jgi:hypothetical protein
MQSTGSAQIDRAGNKLREGSGGPRVLFHISICFFCFMVLTSCARASEAEEQHLAFLQERLNYVINRNTFLGKLEDQLREEFHSFGGERAQNTWALFKDHCELQRLELEILNASLLPTHPLYAKTRSANNLMSEIYTSVLSNSVEIESSIRRGNRETFQAFLDPVSQRLRNNAPKILQLYQNYIDLLK